VIPNNAHACPHCFDDIAYKRSQFELAAAQEHEAALKLSAKPDKKPSRVAVGMSRVFRTLKIAVIKPVSVMNRLFNTMLDRVNLTSKDAVFMMILTYIFAFVAFIGHVRLESVAMPRGQRIIAFYGFPVEWLHVATSTYPIVHNSGIRILPILLIADLIIYFAAAFLVVYGIQRLR
jgi:hypothetical protein